MSIMGSRKNVKYFIDIEPISDIWRRYSDKELCQTSIKCWCEDYILFGGGVTIKNINSSKKISIICYGASVLIFFAIGLLGVFLSAGNEMGYFLLYFYILTPVTALISSLIISIKKGYLFWFYPVFVGLLAIIIPFLLTNTFDMLTLFFAFFPALVGLILGLIIRVKTEKYEIN